MEKKRLRRLRDLISNTVQLDQAPNIELFNAKTVRGETSEGELQNAADSLVDGKDEDELESADEEDLPPNFNHVKTFDLDDEEQNEIIVPLEEKDVREARASSKWFSTDEWFDGLDNGRELEDANLEQVFPKAKRPKLEKMDVAQVENVDMAQEEEEEEDEEDSDSDSDTDPEDAETEYVRNMEERIGT